MFKAVCDCCGQSKLGSMMIRLEYIDDPSICMKYSMEDAEVIRNENRELFTKKYLLCHDCYLETGLPLFAFGREDFRGRLADRIKEVLAKGIKTPKCEETRDAVTVIKRIKEYLDKERDNNEKAAKLNDCEQPFSKSLENIEIILKKRSRRSFKNLNTMY